MNEDEIFIHSLEIACPDDRQAYVDRSCGEDRRLWARVNDLLDAHANAAGFMDQPAAGAAPAVDQGPLREGPGTQIGPYKLLQLIGEGGFGVVYMAEQLEPVRRKVALKIIRLGMDTKNVVARFESERQALALMDHPNIARVLDAGATESGRPYFVMELVKGVPITEFCDKNHLPIAERLRLFIDVCRAVQHAHQKGVIHRDLKPSNVMVTLHDGRPVPKVIDFGVAKATSQQLTERTLFTAYGQMVGTPVYMSPEQAEMSGLDIDTRSDIYSLGVLLYELLTGTTPLEQQRLRSAGLVEMQRLIREEEAQRPSVRLSTLGEQATMLAGQRGTDAKQLRHFLTGDLDWIVMKSLEKDRRRRYETPSDFAADVERFLKQEPIVARPPSASYRFRKFCRRNSGAVAAMASIATVLVLGTIVSTWQAIRATKAEQVAEAARTAEAVQRAAAIKDRDEAQRLQRESQALNAQLIQAAAEERRSTYATEMNLVRIEVQNGNLPRVRELLMKQLPITNDEDLRGFEWYYWYRYLNQAQSLLRIDGFQYGDAGHVMALAPGGNLVAVTRGQKSYIYEAPAWRAGKPLPVRLKILTNRTRMSATGRFVDGPAVSNNAYQGSGPRSRPSAVYVYEPNGKLRTFKIPTKQSIRYLTFLDISRDGRLVAALGNDDSDNPEMRVCRLMVWEVDSGELLLDRAENRELNRLEFSRDGKQLAAYVCHSTKRWSDAPREVAVVFDLPSGEVRGVASHNDEIDGLFWLPDSQRILLTTLGYSGSNRKDLLLWNIAETTPRRISSESMPDYVKGDVSPNGRLFAVSGHTVSTIRLIDTESGNVVNTLHNEGATIDTLTFSDDGKRIVACSTSGEVLNWDLTERTDLFGLRSSPIANADIQECAISDSVSILAAARNDGWLGVRTRDGRQTVLREGDRKRNDWNAILRISPDDRLLAHTTDIRPNGRRMFASSLVTMYDLQTNKPLWQIEVDGAFRNQAVSFSPEGRELVLAAYDEATVLNALTGTQRTIPLPPGAVRCVARTLTLDAINERLLLCGQYVAKDGRPCVCLQDAISGDRIAESRHSKLAGNSPQTVASPDGLHVAVINRQDQRVSVWKLAEDRVVFETDGTTIVFSRDGALAAVGKSDSLGVVASGIGPTDFAPLGQATVWNVATGRRLSTLSLAGNRADEVRFCPDEGRLLTLHGKRALGTGGAVPAGKLWDVVSGREIMSMPIADVNHYSWDLVFDRDGNQLTSVVLGKPWGTGGGLESIVFSARPLSEAEDTALIAEHVVQQLRRDKPETTDFMDALMEDQRLRSPVQTAAVEFALRDSKTFGNLVRASLGRTAFPSLTAREYERALRWSKAIQKVRPNEAEAATILAAALFRAGSAQQAIALLSDDSKNHASEGTTRNRYELLRRSFHALALHRVGRHEDALRLVDEVRREPIVIDDVPAYESTVWGSIIAEVMRTFPSQWNDLAVTFAPLLESDDFLTGFFTQFDANADRHIVRAEVADRADLWKQLAPFDVDKDQRLARSEFSNGMFVYLVATAFDSRNPPPVTAAVQLLSPALRLAPKHTGLLNARAWLWATSPDGRYRNGVRALAEAKKVCEITAWKTPAYLNTYAAALAECGKFSEAMDAQRKAISLADDLMKVEYEAALELYEQGKPYRAATTLLPTETSDKPLLSGDDVWRARRISGWGAAWSPDSKQIVRNMNILTYDKAKLEILDLESGKTTVVCEGGLDPSWSPRRNGPIAFMRNAGPVSEIWLVETDGSNLRKLDRGAFPTFDLEGQLYYRANSEGDQLELKHSKNCDAPGKVVLSIPAAFFPAVSPSGELVALPSTGRLTIRRIDGDGDPTEIDTNAGIDVLAGWSPDSRYVAYGAYRPGNRGFWLWDVQARKRHLLTAQQLTLPRWSPDGRFIAADDRTRNEIVILDVSRLELHRHSAVKDLQSRPQ